MEEQRMSRFEGLSARGRVLPALTVAASVLVFTIAAQLVMSMLYFVVSLFQSQEYQAGFFGAFLSSTFLVMTIAFCAGVFAWLWLFAPLSAELRPGRLIARSLLAVVAGAVVTFIVAFCIQMQAWLAGAQFFSNSLSQATESFGRDGGNAVALAVTSSIQLAVNALPVTVLAIVLTWIWVVRHSAQRVEAAARVEV
jgi:hypothetical protein